MDDLDKGIISCISLDQFSFKDELCSLIHESKQKKVIIFSSIPMKSYQYSTKYNNFLKEQKEKINFKRKNKTSFYSKEKTVHFISRNDKSTAIKIDADLIYMTEPSCIKENFLKEVLYPISGLKNVKTILVFKGPVNKCLRYKIIK